jgi:hypothetical protein
LLGDLEAHLGIVRRFAEWFPDHRDPDRIEHTAFELLAQRVIISMPQRAIRRAEDLPRSMS